MRVTFDKDYKKNLTIAEYETAREIIAQEKEDDFTAKDYAEMLVREALKDMDDWSRDILKADAVIMRNNMAWNKYTADSENVDVWVSAIAETGRGFLKVGGYLTDIWCIGGEDIRSRMWIAYYTEATK